MNVDVSRVRWQLSRRFFNCTFRFKYLTSGQPFIRLETDFLRV